MATTCTPLCTLSEAVAIAVPGPKHLQSAIRNFLLPIWEVEVKKEEIVHKKLVYVNGQYQAIRAMPIQFVTTFMTTWIETAIYKLDPQYKNDLTVFETEKQKLIACEEFSKLPYDCAIY